MSVDKYYTIYKKLNIPEKTYYPDVETPILETPVLETPRFKYDTSKLPDEVKKTWFKNPIKMDLSPVNNNIVNLSFTEMVDKYGDGVIKVGDTKLRSLNSSYGVKNSKHKQAHVTWKNADGTPMPMAYDLTPTKGHTFQDLFRVLGKPEWQLWLANQDNGNGGKGWGIIDESTEELRKQHGWKSTGNHVHLGADSSGWNNYVKAMKNYNNMDISPAMAKEGMKLPEEKEIVVIEKNEPEDEDVLGCLLCLIMNALGLRKHALSETKPEKLSNLLGGDAQVIIEIGGDDIEDSFEDLIKDILPLISETKTYSEDDIKEIRKNKNKYGSSMKKILTLMSDGNILKAFNGMQIYKKGGSITQEDTISEKESIQENKPETIKVKIGDKEFNLKEAKTEEEKEQGLMGVKHLEENEGMIFYYDSPQEVGFWMKNTEIPLDICFFNEDEECISVKQGHPLSNKLIYEKDVMFVVEVPAGSDIKPGDELDLPGDDDEYVMHVLGSDGSVLMSLYGGERIFSRANSRMLIKWAKRAYRTKSESDYRRLGKLVFKYLDILDSNTPEYVQLDSKKS